MAGEEENDVGYGKPPTHTRWQKGQSGNPRGRPRGPKGIKTDLNTVLGQQQTVTVKGETFTGTKQFLYLFMLATRAAAGDLKAAALLGPLILQIFGTDDRGGGREQLSPHDQALLDQLLADYDDTAPDVIPEADTGADGAGDGSGNLLGRDLSSKAANEPNNEA